MNFEGDFEVFQKYRPKAYAGRMAPKEVNDYWSSTNTDFGGEDPGKVEEVPKATFDPRREEGQ